MLKYRRKFEEEQSAERGDITVSEEKVKRRKTMLK
jgi:hypothetical protein